MNIPKVTARLRHPQDGIYTGSVDMVDSLTSTYRITFDRPGLGTHNVPDIEVLANDFTETLSLLSLVQDHHHRTNPNNNNGCSSLTAHNRRNPAFPTANGNNRNDPLLGSEIFNNSKLKELTLPNNTLGGFPLKLLELVIRIRKSLVAKQMKLLRLKNMNAEAEMCRSFDEPLPDDYQRRYASIVIGMEKLNRDMQEYLSQIQSHTSGLSREPLVAALLAPSYLRERCKELAVQTVQKNNQVRNASLMATITDMATVMWVASNVEAGSQQVAQVSQTLEVCLEECRNRLDPDNAEVFQRNVHVHMRHIERDLRLGGDSTLANRLP